MSEMTPGWKTAPTTYEQLTLPSLRAYGTMIWMMLLSLLGMIEITTQVMFNDTGQVAPWFFITLFTVSLPFILYWVRDQIVGLNKLLCTFVDYPPQMLDVWSCEYAYRTVSGDWRKWALGAITAVAGLITLAIVSLPLLQSPVVRAVISAGILVKMFFAGTLVYNVLFGLSLPSQVAKLPLRDILYQDEFTGFLSLSRLLFTFSLVASFVYLIVFGALTTGPFPMSIFLLAWLVLTGVLAGITIPVSLLGLHRIMRNNKRDALVKLAPRLEALMQKCIDDPTPENLEHIQTAMHFRNEIAQMPEWPIKTDAFAALFTSLLLPIIAIAIEIWN